MHRILSLLTLLLPALAAAQPAAVDTALVERYIAAERLAAVSVAVGTTDGADAGAPTEAGSLAEAVRQGFADDFRPGLLADALVTLEGAAYERVRAATAAWNAGRSADEVRWALTEPIGPDEPAADSALTAAYVAAQRAADQPADVQTAALAAALDALPDSARAALDARGIPAQMYASVVSGERPLRMMTRAARRHLADVDPADIMALTAFYRSEAGRYVGRVRAIATAQTVHPMRVRSLEQTAAAVSAGG